MAKKTPRKRVSALRVFLTVMLFVVIVAGTAGFVHVSRVLKDLPAISRLEPRPSATSFIYDANGKVFAPLHAEENRIPISIKRVPEHVRQAFIAIEDANFYDHHGIDIRGFTRAAINTLTGKQLQGGSTITQQLVKNAFLTPIRSLDRKIQEAFLSIELERRYTKDEILGMYLNQILFGNGTYGIQAASQLYFGKNVEDLTVAEAALLAGMVQSPSNYDPYTKPQASRARQATVLQAMAKHGFISQEEADKAAAQPLIFKPLKKNVVETGGFFADYVLQQLLSRYTPEMVYESGLQVYTTVDPNIQKAAEKAIAKVLDPVFPIKQEGEYPEAAAIVMDPKTGYIKAIVGGRKHDRWLQHNRAVQSKRQPGSAFKPIMVYTAAIDRGAFTPASVIDDAPVKWPQTSGEDWIPENYDRKFLGLMTLREALERSRNVVAVKVLDRIGVKTGADYAENLGITTLVRVMRQGKNDLNLSAGLGGVTDGVTPLDMTVAFGVFASGGMKQEPISILKVVDRNGNVLEEHRPKGTRVLKPQTAWLMTDMLKGTIGVPWGTGTRANIGRPAAGKTGTTSDWKDAWFCGYTPDLVGVVWMGFDKDKTMEKWKVTGGTYPAAIWKDLMVEAHRTIPSKDFPVPKDIVQATICTKSGKLPSPACPAETLRSEVFIKGTEPPDICDIHVLVEVCADNPAELAGPFCPNRVTKSFIRRVEPYLALEDGRKPADAEQEVPQKICALHNPVWQ
ncbi:MAG: penicillin-binding protein 1A [Firmicutes bacterium]|nr:penicillin-binding protein 1A [Bacillota bacterium]